MKPGKNIALLGLLAASAAALSADAPPVRVMPLGDSITLGYSVPTYLSGYRDLLYAILTDDGYNVDFVGTLTDTQNPSIPDPDHEGHGGYRIDQIDAGLQSWLDAIAQPDVVLLNIGTNDFWQNYQTGTAATRLENLVVKIASLRPSARILLSTLTPRTDSSALASAELAFNAAIPGIVNRQLAAGRRIYFVDLYPKLTASDLSSDGVHPAQSGYDKMAAAWVPAIETALTPQPTPLANGSFESGATGWTLAGNVNVFAAGGQYQASDGTNLVIFNGGQTTPNGVVSQAFATNPGEVYVVQFDAGVSAYNTNQQKLTVRAQGGSTLLSQTVTLTGVGSGTTKWSTALYTFTANSATTSLSFTDTSTTTNSIDLLLDHVEIRPRTPRTLSVASTPVTGLPITVTPADNSGATDGSTGFSRVFGDGAVVTLTAPGTSGSYSFRKWQLDGADFATSSTATFALDADHALTAVYGPPPPVIVGQPADLTATVGQPASFTVSATGGPLSYQWQRDGTPISGATDATFTIASVATTDAATYQVVVTNTAGAATSDPATLTVVTSGVIADGGFETGFSGWSASGNASVLPASAPYVATEGTHLVVFNSGNTSPNGAVAQRFNTTAGQTYTLQFDAGVMAYNTKQQAMRVTVLGSATLLDQTVTLTGVGSGTTRWASQQYSFVADSATTTITFADISTITTSIDLLLDHVRVTNQAAVPVRTLTVNSSPAAGVAITVSPADQDAAGNGTTGFLRHYNAGTVVTLTAPASSGGDTFQKWQQDGADLSTSATVNLTLDTDSTLTAVYAPATPPGAFTNGSFESGYTGWTTSGNQSVQPGSGYYTATDGSFINLFNGGDSTPNGVLSQTFATTAGQSYTLQFDAGVMAFNTRQQKLQITVSGTATLVNQTVTLNGANHGTVIWAATQYSFVADSAATTVTFRDVSTTSASIDLLLDHVRVTTVAPAVAHTLSVAADPAAVAIAVSPADHQGQTDGTTAFTREYDEGTVITLTAPAAAGGNVFQDWQQDGAELSTSPTVNVTLDADSTLTAFYVPAPPPAAFTNGSFESGYTGWTASGNQSVQPGSGYYSATDGDSINLFNGGDTTPDGVLTQTFATTAGQTYTLQFDAGVMAFNTRQQKLQVTVQGATTLLSQTVTLTGAGHGTIGWSPQQYSFVADSAATTLTFRDVSPATASIDLLLDHVRVSEPAPVAVRTLTVESSPDTAVAISVSPADNHGDTDGTTAFTRLYDSGTAVTLTAPASAGGDVFQSWQQDGTELSTNATVSLPVDADTTLNAVYAPPTPPAAFTNGSFESDYAAWSATGNQSVQPGTGYYAATDGDFLNVFNGGDRTPDGLLTQTFATMPGRSYTLSFDAGVMAYNTRQQNLQVSVAGGNTLVADTITLTGVGHGMVSWRPSQYVFVADSSATTLTFADVSSTTTSIDLLLDHVRVTP